MGESRKISAGEWFAKGSHVRAWKACHWHPLAAWLTVGWSGQQAQRSACRRQYDVGRPGFGDMLSRS